MQCLVLLLLPKCLHCFLTLEAAHFFAENKLQYCFDLLKWLHYASNAEYEKPYTIKKGATFSMSTYVALNAF